uniref:Uncharacterized protein n=1 Tax=Glossina palpalis gambiensis TaxID=67801 RepID=A0A1B0BXP4_9MUSC
MIKVKINNLTLCHINAGRSDARKPFIFFLYVIEQILYCTFVRINALISAPNSVSYACSVCQIMIFYNSYLNVNCMRRLKLVTDLSHSLMHGLFEKSIGLVQFYLIHNKFC